MDTNTDSENPKYSKRAQLPAELVDEIVAYRDELYATTPMSRRPPLREFATLIVELGLQAAREAAKPVPTPMDLLKARIDG